ncbi:CBASS oligonucleotide cyclase [Micromonospora sp. CPCC 206061]|uniref:CBASS oligonucleotide cyclase n=1 Tax=Micromonospora sp. CPCC 206061 TaxID=3122410 RepID=UPI002FF3309E
MGYIDEAFIKLKHNLEITATEQKLASARHEAVRDFVRGVWQLIDDFLTGSYRRDTKTKKLKDVDIFLVIDPDGPQGGYRHRPPLDVLNALLAVLRDKWPDAHRDGMAIVIPYGGDVMSIEVVPAFKRSAGGYFIPDPAAGSWIETNPKRHHELSIEKNKACDGMYVPLVKMIKGINRELGEPVSPSFLLEVMAQTIVKTPVGRYQDEIVLFLATAADRIDETWLDPAGLGGDVNTVMTSADKRAAARALRDAQCIAEVAVDLEDEEQDRAAYAQWKRLFGDRMTQP